MNKSHGYIINEAEGNHDAGWYPTFMEAAEAMKRLYTEEELEKLHPSIGKVLPDGSVTYEF